MADGGVGAGREATSSASKCRDRQRAARSRTPTGRERSWAELAGVGEEKGPACTMSVFFLQF